MMARERGKEIETEVCHFLQKQGLRLVERNYHCRGGEIDLIMQDRLTLVFVEVRYRKSSGFGGALASIDMHKQSRIIHTASHYLQRHDSAFEACRFDVVGVSPDGKRYKFQWVKDAFQSV
jgi:putative endonuclease